VGPEATVVLVDVLTVVVVVDVVEVAVACPVEHPATISALRTVSPSHDARLVVTERRYTSPTTTFQDAALST